MGDFKKKITDFHYGKSSFFLNCLFVVPSIFYNGAITVKNLLYEMGTLKEKKVNAKVICVGNLTTGGVGKTPLVIEIANYLSSYGKKVCVLSRGYGGKASKTNSVYIVKTPSDKEYMSDVALTGDEVDLIAKNTENCGIIISKNRYKGAQFAIQRFDSEIIIMDDGFSNRSLYKDLSIILWDTEKLYGNGHSLPLGPLREPLSQMKRAQKVLFINKNGKKSDNLEKFISELKIPYSFCKMEVWDIYNILYNKQRLIEKEIFAFSGIGSPKQFYQNLNQFDLKGTMSFDDHFEYSQKTIDEINKRALESGAKAIVTTEKDMVKILKFDNIENFYALKLKPVFDIEELLSGL